MKPFDLERANDFSIGAPVSVIALLGPPASGKSTFIKLLLDRYPGRFGRIRIYLTRSCRKGETSKERNCLTEDEFHDKVMRDELCFISNMYGFWVGADRDELADLVATGKPILIDPNNYDRLAMLGSLFPAARITTLTFAPHDMQTLRGMSEGELRGLFGSRIDNREKIPESEAALRVEECVATVREMCARPVGKLIVNDFATPPEKVFAEIDAIVAPLIGSH